MFSNLFLRSFRILLLPFAVIYWLGLVLRNAFYSLNILKSVRFNLPIICVGNLSIGGTGKSPMVEYLTDLLKDHYKIAILSRGYKRKTTGYALAGESSTALDIGDEPMQFYLKYPQVPVAVGEKRVEAIPQLLHDNPDTQAIILDDAFQHRAIKAGLNLLLTEYNNLYVHDFYLPTGDLRDLKISARRAELIVVTKCPADIAEADRTRTITAINPLKTQQVYFASMEYGQAYHIINKTGTILDNQTEVLLVTGIANPQPLEKLLEEYSGSYNKMQYPDHHIFTIDDLKDIKKRFENIEHGKKIILTTEKDAVRLVKFGKALHDLPMYVLPVRHHFLFGETERFNQHIRDFINQFQRKN